MTYVQTSSVYLRLHKQLMILFSVLLIWTLVSGKIFASYNNTCPFDLSESGMCDSIPYIIESHQNEQDIADDSSSSLANYKMRHDRKGFRIEIGHEVFIITDSLGSGADAITYMAKDVNDHDVVIKVFYGNGDKSEYFRLEVLATERLGRLLAKDDLNFIVVLKYIKGNSFNSELGNYSSEKAGDNDYPSNHQAIHLKGKYFNILWKFRNATQMAHNDFRPYNIIGEEAIDFDRSEELSSDPIKRQKQIEWDDNHAEKEWEYFYLDEDFYAIQNNPLLPDSLIVAFDIWDKYISRYSSYDGYKKFRVHWMRELYYLVDSKNITEIMFPKEDEFE